MTRRLFIAAALAVFAIFYGGLTQTPAIFSIQWTNSRPFHHMHYS